MQKIVQRKFIIEIELDSKGGYFEDSFEAIKNDILTELSCCYHSFCVKSIKEEPRDVLVRRTDP